MHDVPDIVPEIGITGTPVIDGPAATMFLVAASKRAEGTIVQRLHALDIVTGNERPGSPVEIAASVPGTGIDSVDGVVPFSAAQHLQRPALLLSNGVVWVAFGSHGDAEPYHGWLLGYSASTFALVSAFNTTPDGSEASIWQAGGGVAADRDGALYVMTANGDFDVGSGGRDYGSAFVKLSPAGAVLDWFTPSNQAYLSMYDLDLGAGGPMLLPDMPGAHPHLMVGGGKEGVMYVLDRDNLGHFNAAGNSQIVAKVAVTPGPVSGIATTPAYFNGAIYVVASNGPLRAFRLSGGVINQTPTVSPNTLRGGSPAISANGTEGGVVWVAETASQAAPAEQHAWDASEVTKELYTSPSSGINAAGLASKFMMPTIANGKVYVPTQTEVSVYGLKP